MVIRLRSGNDYFYLNRIALFFVLFSRINNQLAENNIVFLIAIGVSGIGILLRINRLINSCWKGYFFWCLSFLALYILSYFWSVNKNITTVNFIATLGRYICYLYVILNIDSGDGLEKVINLYFAAVLVNDIYILVFLGASSVIRSASSLNKSIAGNANLIGMSSACAAILKYYLIRLFDYKKSYNNLINKVLCVFLLVFVILTGSKKALLMPVIVISVMFFLSKKYKIKNLIVIIACIALAYVLILKVPFLYRMVGERIEKLVVGMINVFKIEDFGLDTNIYNTGLTASDRTRVYLILNGIKRFIQNPVAGYGMATYRVFTSSGLYAHNNYIEIAVGLGLIGVVLYYSFYVMIAKKLAFISKKTNREYFAVALIILYLVLDIGLVSYLCLEAHLCLAISYHLANNAIAMNDGEHKNDAITTDA